MELGQIKHFVAVMQCGSFTAAAERCAISQPGLTKSIRALERELGGPLFHREGNRLVMSELGRTMAPILTNLDGQAGHAARVAESFQVLKTGSLRVGVTSTIGGARLAPLLARFRRQHPGVDVEIHVSNSSDIGERLSRGDVDFAIMNDIQLERGQHQAELLYREHYVVAFGPGHRFDSFAEVKLADLMGESYVDRLSCELRKQFQTLCADRELTLVPIARAERDDWTQELVANGLGCAVLPAFSVRHPRLSTRPLVQPEVTREVSIVRMRGRKLTSAAAKLRDILKKDAASRDAGGSVTKLVRAR